DAVGRCDARLADGTRLTDRPTTIDVGLVLIEDRVAARFHDAGGVVVLAATARRGVVVARGSRVSVRGLAVRARGGAVVRGRHRPAAARPGPAAPVGAALAAPRRRRVLGAPAQEPTKGRNQAEQPCATLFHV